MSITLREESREGVAIHPWRVLRHRLSSLDLQIGEKGECQDQEYQDEHANREFAPTHFAFLQILPNNVRGLWSHLKFQLFVKKLEWLVVLIFLELFVEAVRAAVFVVLKAPLGNAFSRLLSCQSDEGAHRRAEEFLVYIAFRSLRDLSFDRR